jgi:hypothetical protein
MRGDDRQPDSMFSHVFAAQRVPPDHPLRAIRSLVDDVLRDMSRRCRNCSEKVASLIFASWNLGFSPR